VSDGRVVGYRCWFCARRYAKAGESPTVWQEFMCGRDDCSEDEFWNWTSRRRIKSDPPGDTG
jgi:hypothetical protein